MQEFVSPPLPKAPIGGSYSGGRGSITHHEIRRFIKRYAATIAGSIALAVLAAAIYVLTATPLYTARTQIIIDPSLPQVFRDSNKEFAFSIDNAQVESQLVVLRSETIAQTVVDKLKLKDVPEFADREKSASLLPSWLHLPTRLTGPRTPTTTDAATEDRLTLERLQAGLDIRRVGMSYAIDILFSSRSPQLAAQIANATADAYIQEQLSARAQAATQGTLWLEERINGLREQMNAAALKAQEFRARRDYRIATSPDEGSATQKATQGNVRDNRTEGSNRPNTIEELESTAQTYRRIYESYLSAYTESVQKQSYPVSNARVITAATPPLTKSHPKTKLILALGALSGCLAGLGIAFCRHSLDRSVRDARQMREETGVDCLATIPHLVIRTPRSPLHQKLFGRTKKRDRLTVITDMPFSPFSHGIKTLKTAISIAARTREIRTIGITSALPNEGKTTIASNLATLFALSGSKTLIIDADCRNASLSRSFAPDMQHGIVDVIAGFIEVERCLVRSKDSDLHLLPAGGSTIVTYSDELLGSARARLVLQNLQKSFDIIIVELPPINASIEGLAMSSLLDGVVLVAEWGMTPLPVLSEVVHVLRKAHAEILGIALNKVDPSSSGYGQTGSHYFSKYLTPYAPVGDDAGAHGSTVRT